MDLISPAVAAGATVVVIYLARRKRGQRSTRPGVKGSRSQGASGHLPRRSWLVKVYNSSGASKVDSEDLPGATAEWTGRAVGAAGRKSKRRWVVIKKAAERSRGKREKRWDQNGRPPLLGSRKPSPAPKTVQPPVTAQRPNRVPPASTPDPEHAKRHLRAVPDPTTPHGDAVTTTQDTPAATTAAQPDMPPDWALINDRIRNYAPEDDAALLAFMKGEVAGAIGYAEALEQARENCTNDVGLDPSAVAGFTAYSEHMSEATEKMAEAWRTFVAVYGEVQALAANGVAMPHNGRFWTGAAS